MGCGIARERELTVAREKDALLAAVAREKDALLAAAAREKDALLFAVPKMYYIECSLAIRRVMHVDMHVRTKSSH